MRTKHKKIEVLSVILMASGTILAIYGNIYDEGGFGSARFFGNIILAIGLFISAYSLHINKSLNSD